MGTVAVADGEQRLHFLLTFLVAGREGTIWKEKVRSLKYIYDNKSPEPGGGGGREEKEMCSRPPRSLRDGVGRSSGRPGRGGGVVSSCGQGPSFDFLLLFAQHSTGWTYPYPHPG